MEIDDNLCAELKVCAASRARKASTICPNLGLVRWPEQAVGNRGESAVTFATDTAKRSAS